MTGLFVDLCVGGGCCCYNETDKSSMSADGKGLREEETEIKQERK